MAGILGAALYVPQFRLPAEAIASAWDRPGKQGLRSVASYDEDALTLAAAAAGRVGGHLQAEALYFASTSGPLAEKSAAAVIADALGLPGSVRTADFAGGGRAATTALIMALEGPRRVLVAAGECRLAPPGSPLEAQLGDGGAALLVGEGPALARVVGVHSVTREFPDQWRQAGDPFIRSGDERFNLQEGYLKAVEQAVIEALRRWDVRPGDIAQAFLGGPHGRAAESALRRLGLSGPGEAASRLAREVGSVGAAQPLMLLAAGLGEAAPGDKLLVVGYGDGVDVLLLEATERAAELKGAAERALAGAQRLPHYNRYLVYRGLVPGQGQADPFHSTIMLHREAALFRRLEARECPGCGFLLALDQHTCPRCHHRGEFRARRLARTGRVFAVTEEWYTPTPQPPVTMAVVDLEGGGRLTLQMADGARNVALGTPVELTLRRLHAAGGLPHYYWKARVQTGGQGA